MSKIEEAVCKKIKERAKLGLQKYGVTMEREDLTMEEWFVHLQEELMDGAVYIERLIKLSRILEVLADEMRGSE